MKKRDKKDIYSIILKALMTFSAICYLIIFIDEITPPFYESLLGIMAVPYLFTIFLIGYYFSLKSDFLASGIFVIAWYSLMWIFAAFLWVTGAGTVLGLGLPVFILGLLMLVKGIIKKYK